MKFFLLTLMLVLLSPTVVYSQGELVGYLPTIVTGYYVSPVEVNLGKVLKDDISLKPGISRGQLESIVASIKKFNPAVINWRAIPAGEKIYLEIPYEAVSPDSILFKKKNRRAEAPVEPVKIQPVYDDLEKNENVAVPLEAEKPKPAPVVKDTIKESFAKDEQAVTYLENKVRYSLIASTSLGTFKETSPAGNKISSKQFSPITLGLSVSVSDAPRIWSFSSSIYFSYLRTQEVPVTAGIQNTSISTPVEIGITAYVQRMLAPQLFSVFTGIDAEKFSTLNLVELEEGRSTVLSNREHLVLYGTLGANLYLKFKKQAINLRTSYSKSVASDVNGNVEPYKGYKAIFYVQVPINERFYLNTFYKYHNMSGESELTVTRIGLGIGYLF